MTEESVQPERSIGVVVIGRNEGERLDQCLLSVLACVDASHVVYVDSESSDGSPERAAAHGVIVEELAEVSLTAARGRQRGTDALLARYPDLTYIQFIDGDCILQSEWLSVAQACLEAQPDIGGVSGRRREERCQDNAWSRLLDIDWDIPAGEAAHVGGDSLVRVVALREINGWCEELIAGEDPDLGFRMRDAGWRIVRLDNEMTSHDAGMTGFGQYWRRATRSGHAYAEVGWRHRRGSGAGWWRRTQGIIGYALGSMVIAVAGVWFWPLWFLLLVLWGRLGFVLYRHARGKGVSRTLAIRYAACNAICKFANLLGILQYWLGRMRGERVALIEYKPHPTS